MIFAVIDAVWVQGSNVTDVEPAHSIFSMSPITKYWSTSQIVSVVVEAT
ncbi:MAG: Uncharacterised protein [Chloroflexota bacterium]|nr:MAG: Uncharacterised protein [Chloroflexota bacterium]